MGTTQKTSKCALRNALNDLRKKCCDFRARALAVTCYVPEDPVRIDEETVSMSCKHPKYEYDADQGIIIKHKYIPDMSMVIPLEKYKSITEEICKINRLGYHMGLRYHMEAEYLCCHCIKDLIESGNVEISKAVKTYFNRVPDKNSLFTIYFQKDGKGYYSLYPIIDKWQILLTDLKNLYNFLEEWEKHEYTLPEDIKASGIFDFDAIEYLTGIKNE